MTVGTPQVAGQRGLIRWGHEINGNWYVETGPNGQNPKDYLAYDLHRSLHRFALLFGYNTIPYNICNPIYISNFSINNLKQNLYITYYIISIIPTFLIFKTH
jgi:hypothetical protein